MANATITESGETIQGFHSGTFTASDGFHLTYRLFRPPAAEPGMEKEGRRRFPLLVQLHGAGSWEPGNSAQLGQAARWVRPEFPAYILAPKTNRPMKWVDLDWSRTEHRQPAEPGRSLRATRELVEIFLRENAGTVDPARVYLNGQSMGGYGAWDMLTRWPELFAGAVIVCGGGDVSTMERLKDKPVWVFHGALDGTVPVENSRRLVAALRRAGNDRVRYTEYADVHHDSWVRAYDDPETFRWLWSQSQESESL